MIFRSNSVCCSWLHNRAALPVLQKHQKERALCPSNARLMLLEEEHFKHMRGGKIHQVNCFKHTELILCLKEYWGWRKWEGNTAKKLCPSEKTNFYLLIRTCLWRFMSIYHVNYNIIISQTANNLSKPQFYLLFLLSNHFFHHISWITLLFNSLNCPVRGKASSVRILCTYHHVQLCFSSGNQNQSLRHISEQLFFSLWTQKHSWQSPQRLSQNQNQSCSV